MRFADYIKDRRECLALTQKQLAEAIGVDVPMYSRIERGLRPIKEEQVSILANQLGENEATLRNLWVADKVSFILENESDPNEILSIVAGNCKKPLKDADE